MDRLLIVRKNGAILAEMNVQYTRSTTATLTITYNRIIDLGDGMTSTYPLFTHTDEYYHVSANTVEDVRKEDMKTLIRYASDDDFSDPGLQFDYEQVQYRYVVKAREVAGIAEINADFVAGKKEMSFLSARRMKEDGNETADSMQSNFELIRRFCEERLELYGIEIVRVEWN